MSEFPPFPPTDTISDFPSLLLTAPEDIGALDQQLSTTSGFSDLLAFHDTQVVTSQPAARNVRRFEQAIIAEYEGSHQEQLLNTLFGSYGFDGAFEYMEQVVTEDFPEHIKPDAIERIRGMHVYMRSYFGEEFLPKKNNGEDSKVPPEVALAYERILHEVENTPDYEHLLLQLYSMSDTITREDNPYVHALLKTLSTMDLVLDSNLICDIITCPNEELQAKLFASKARELYDEGDQKVRQLVTFMRASVGMISDEEIIEGMLRVNPDEWPSYLQLPIKTHVQDIISAALKNYRATRGNAAPSLRKSNSEKEERDSVTTILHNALEQTIRHSMRASRVSSGSRKINLAKLPIKVRRLSAFLNGEEIRIKRERDSLRAPVQDAVEVTEVIEPREIHCADLQNSHIAVSDTSVSDRINEYCKGLPNSAILAKNIQKMLTSTAEADFSSRVSGLKQLSSTKGGRVKDEDGRPINLFELKPTELNAGIKINGQLLKQTRIVIAMHSDGSLGLVLIGKRDKIDELLRNRGLS